MKFLKNNWIAILIGTIVLFFLITSFKFISNWFQGLFKDKDQMDYEKLKDENKKVQDEARKRQMDEKPSTKGDNEWIEIANTLQYALSYAGYLQSYRDKALVELKRCKNNTDYLKLEQFWGRRPLKSPLLIDSGSYTIPMGVKERLSAKEINELNNSYAQRGISQRF